MPPTASACRCSTTIRRARWTCGSTRWCWTIAPSAATVDRTVDIGPTSDDALGPVSVSHPKQWDVIVVGAGHAGCEAALAAARLGKRVLMLTGNLDTIGQMSCNPAVGGVGKGHLVKEIEALGGVMARVTDQCGIQFRRLNTSKGPAVRATRAHCDKARYRR